MNKIVVTTENKDFIVVNFDTKEIEHVAEKSEALVDTSVKNKGRDEYRPFGVEIDEDFIYVLSNTKMARYKKATYEYDSNVFIPELYVNTHQILKNNSTWYVCNTAIDCISVYNGQEVKHFNVNLLNTVDITLKPKNANLLDSRHVNTITDMGEKLYFCRHNRGIVFSDFWELDKGSFQARRLVNAGGCCHGIKVVENTLYTLSTATGNLLAVDLLSNKIRKQPLVDPDQVFLRGLEIIDGKIVIGASINYKKNKEDKSAYLIVIDLSDNTHSEIQLPSSKVINDLKGF